MTVPAELVSLRIAEQVLARCQRDPQGIAVAGGSAVLHYGALGERATALAAVLTTRGIGPQQRVAVLLERGPDLLVALLAVAASGAAYLPIDPEYPPERIAYLLRDAGVSAVLTQPAHNAKVGAMASSVPVLDVGAPWAEPVGAARPPGASMIPST